MRKMFIAGITLLCVTLIASCGGKGNGNGDGNGQSEQDPLVGKWLMKKEQKDAEGTAKFILNLDLKADKTMTYNIDASMEGSQQGFTMVLPVNMAFEGTWSATGDKLELKVDSATTKINIDKEKMVIKADDPKLEKQIAVLKQTLIASMESSAKGDISKRWVPQEAMAYKLEGKTLKWITEKDTLVFEKQ